MVTTNIVIMKTEFVVIVTPKLQVEKITVKNLTVLVDGLMESVQNIVMSFIGSRRQMATWTSKNDPVS